MNKRTVWWSLRYKSDMCASDKEKRWP
jgi:hypothetical protein